MRPIPLRDIKNLVGRAGRAGHNLKGLVIAINDKEYSYIKPVIHDDITLPVEGHLYRVVTAIKNYLAENKLELSEQLFEETGEGFLSLIDKIDSSLISLLPEDETGDLESVALDLARKTFAYHHSNDEDKEWVDKLFRIRGNIVKKLIDNQELQKIREVGVSPRLYSNLRDIVLKSPLLDDDSISFDALLNYFFDIVSQLPQYISELQSFNEKEGLNLETNNLKDIIRMWTAGKWYHEIAKITQIEIEQILELFSSFIDFNLKLLFSAIVKALEQSHGQQLFVEISKNLPEFLELGLNDDNQLWLRRMGMHNRFAILSIDRWIKTQGHVLLEQEALKNLLKANFDSLSRRLKLDLPNLAFDEAEQFLHELTNTASIFEVDN